MLGMSLIAISYNTLIQSDDPIFNTNHQTLRKSSLYTTLEVTLIFHIFIGYHHVYSKM